MNVQEYRGIILNDILIPSLKKLYDIDYNNIKFGVSERNICARLALHMENMMREYDNQNSTHMFSKYFADVEYNRMGNGDIKKYENSEKRPQSMVSDLLIQSRDYKRNFLAIEMKRKGNRKKCKEDRGRLRRIVSSQLYNSANRCVHNTLIGAFIIYSIDDVLIELYEDRNGNGEKKGDIKLNFNHRSRHLETNLQHYGNSN